MGRTTGRGVRRGIRRGIATAAVLGLLAAACGSDDDSGADDTDTASAAEDTASAAEDEASGGDGTGDTVDTLEVMSRWTAGTSEAAAFDAALADFTASTGIDVDVIDAAEELDVTYETALAAGAEPHLVVINLFDKSIAWLDAGATVDVSGYLDAWGLADVIDPATVAEWTTADGRIQGFPYSGFAWPVWYNSALLAEAGIDQPPTTVDELTTAAQALRDAGIAPLVVGGGDWSGQKLFAQIAQSYVDADTATSLFAGGGWCDNPDALRGIELFVDLHDSGLFIDDVEGYSADLMNETFYTAGAAIMPAGSWAFDATPEELRADIVLGGFPLPDGAAYDQPTVYQGFTGVGFMISPRGEEEALGAIEQLVTSMYDEANYAPFVSGANLVPTIQLEDPSVATNPLLQTVLGTDYSSNTAVAVLPDVHVPAASNDGFGQAIALAYTGADADSICSQLDSAY